MSKRLPAAKALMDRKHRQRVIQRKRPDWDIPLVIEEYGEFDNEESEHDSEDH